MSLFIMRCINKALHTDVLLHCGARICIAHIFVVRAPDHLCVANKYDIVYSGKRKKVDSKHKRNPEKKSFNLQFGDTSSHRFKTEF